MRRTLIVVAALLLTIAPAGVAPPAAAERGFHRCEGGSNPQGQPGRFFSSIQARNLRCRKARLVTRDWARETARRGERAARFRDRDFVLWKCRFVFEPSSYDDGGRLLVRCAASGERRLRFIGSP